MPAGLFIPNILFGACIGRTVGEELCIIFPNLDVHPGVYALMGAAGMLGGFSRMTVSLTMIMLEITSNMRMLLPLMLCIMIAKAVADRFTVSVYDVILELNPSIHMLERLDEDREAMLQNLNVHDVCNADVVVLKANEPLSSIIRVLLVTQYSGYPVVDSHHHVLGFVARTQLAEIIADHAVVMDDSEPYSPQAPGKNPTINVVDYADTASETIRWSASVSRGFRQFSATGIQHLCVVDEFNILLGILTRTDFSKLGAHGAHGRKEVQEILDRKLARGEGGSNSPRMQKKRVGAAKYSPWGAATPDASSRPSPSAPSSRRSSRQHNCFEKGSSRSSSVTSLVQPMQQAPELDPPLLPSVVSGEILSPVPTS